MSESSNSMDVEQTAKEKEDKCIEIEENNVDAIHDIIDYLVHNNNVCFKSQQIGEVDLTSSEKRNIALEIYNKGHLPFLERLGKYLKLEHISYFENFIKSNKIDNFELNYRINELKRTLSREGRKCIVKNRRYDALSKMIQNTTYFSEVEMMQRNPLLYEQLVGQYMTESEKKARDNIDTDNITFLNVVLKGIEKQRMRDMMDSQREAEEHKESNSDDDNSMNDNSNSFKHGQKWGEFDNAPAPKKKNRKNKNVGEETLITAPERNLLKEEFVQEMYRSFLSGEDDDFDYHNVDDNPEYDCLDVRIRDEEEKYFDNESPEEIEIDNQANSKNEENCDSEDELDVFMKHLNKHPALEKIIQN